MTILPVILALAALAQDAPEVAIPGELVVCGTDDSRDSHECRAQVAIDEGRHADAAAEFAALADSAPQLSEAARARAAAAPLYNLAGDFEAALASASAALAANSLEDMQAGWTQLDKAWALHRLGRAAEAEVALAAAATHVQDDPYYWLQAAEMALDAGDASTALVRIAQAEQRAPDSPEILTLKGEASVAAGDPEAAAAAWRAAIAAMPDHPSAKLAAEALAALEGTAR